ncbi:MAG: flagellar hook-basal body complex protein FliE [Rhodocyclaceae bacterium]|nr:flagellar hook-basal body complex protein FliE [Rhodocyclaceae bacterium]MDZ4215259.1 flagellar hook-basal body complex protein FliE [Rhodocyclaceae bacterium]
MDTRNLEQMLSELRAASAVAGGKPAAAAQDASGADFGLALKSAIDQVSNAQQQAQQMAQGLASGDESVQVQDVMINLQKASLSFQQMVQVRNKLVSAYQDVMNMPV